MEQQFRKSSHSFSDGGCLEAAFRKSSHSFHEANCAEAALRGAVLVRDSRVSGGPVLDFSPAVWQQLDRKSVV